MAVCKYMCLENSRGNHLLGLTNFSHFASFVTSTPSMLKEDGPESQFHMMSPVEIWRIKNGEEYWRIQYLQAYAYGFAWKWGIPGSRLAFLDTYIRMHMCWVYLIYWVKTTCNYCFGISGLHLLVHPQLLAIMAWTCMWLCAAHRIIKYVLSAEKEKYLLII